MTHTYLALGDSYTIGEAVLADDRWCHQIVYQLRQKGMSIALPDIIATTGWTTAELLQGIENEQGKLQPHSYDLLSVFIGVNNQYRKLPIHEYRSEFREVLQKAIDFAGGLAEKVIVLSIPDWGHTPFATENNVNETEVAEAIDLFNQVCKEETLGIAAHFVDITPSSRSIAGDVSFIASDQLHFAGKMYEVWAEKAFPVCKQILEGK